MSKLVWLVACLALSLITGDLNMGVMKRQAAAEPRKDWMLLNLGGGGGGLKIIPIPIPIPYPISHPKVILYP